MQKNNKIIDFKRYTSRLDNTFTLYSKVCHKQFLIRTEFDKNHIIQMKIF